MPTSDQIHSCKIYGNTIQAFLNFRGFDFLDFRFNAVYNSILFSSPLVLLSNLNLRFCFRFFLCPHINSVNRGMPVPSWMIMKLPKHFGKTNNTSFKAIFSQLNTNKTFSTRTDLFREAFSVSCQISKQSHA